MTIKRILPGNRYSEAVIAGGFIYCAGMVPAKSLREHCHDGRQSSRASPREYEGVAVRGQLYARADAGHRPDIWPGIMKSHA